ncbi:MAG TPA: cobyrinate a,c-diamide synthase [Thermodesulfobacteriota bacterium]|nr:cobyrinate a,c-diamide synthase [Thermodesulfobacteriota bacterium]
MSLPRIMIASLRGGSGKTVISMGITAAWKSRGHKIIPFKKGPDYIDAGWLAMAAGHPCYNLDPFLMEKGLVIHSFQSHAQKGDFSLTEGNRGLFDGIDPQGTYSTAELAKLLKCPLVLILDCTKSTRTVAAMALGCQKMDPELDLKGFILNHLAGSRHETIVRQSLEHYTGLPVLGTIPRLSSSHFPERHLGLLPFQEHPEVEKAVASARKIAEDYIDLDRLEIIANGAPIQRPFIPYPVSRTLIETPSASPVFGVIQDAAFQFYYPENLEALEKAGLKVVFLNALSGDFPSNLDGLYIGGGFPESQAFLLAQNADFRRALKRAIEQGLPVYAECGGLMYLGETITYEGNTYPMVGTLPVNFVLEKKPLGHGYTMLRVQKENPYFPVGKTLRGHEFHYSRISNWTSCQFTPVFEMVKGYGLDGRGDGITYKNVLASYTHLHALGCPEWAEALKEQAENHRVLSGQTNPEEQQRGLG